MDWILKNIYASCVTVAFIGTTAVNFYKIGQNFREIKKLEDRIEDGEKENKQMIHDIYNEIKQMRIEMQTQMRDGFDKLNDRMFDLLAAEIDKQRK